MVPGALGGVNKAGGLVKTGFTGLRKGVRQGRNTVVRKMKDATNKLEEWPDTEEDEEERKKNEEQRREEEKAGEGKKEMGEGGNDELSEASTETEASSTETEDVEEGKKEVKGKKTKGDQCAGMNREIEQNEEREWEKVGEVKHEN